MAFSVVSSGKIFFAHDGLGTAATHHETFELSVYFLNFSIDFEFVLFASAILSGSTSLNKSGSVPVMLKKAAFSEAICSNPSAFHCIASLNASNGAFKYFTSASSSSLYSTCTFLAPSS